MTPGWPVRSVWGGAFGTWAVARSWDASTLSEHRWAAVAGLLAVAWVAVAVPWVQRWWPQPGAVPALVGGALFATYCCVPETDQIPQVAAVVVIAVVVEVGARRSLPWWVTSALYAWVVWAGLFGATGRVSALVGALFAVWPFVLVPVACALVPAMWSGGDRSLVGTLPMGRLRVGWMPVGRLPVPAVVAAVGCAATVAVARTGALEPVQRPAVVAVVVAVAATTVVAVVIALVADRVTDRPPGQK